MNAFRIGFAGMSHLGVCSAFVAAKKEFQSICFDPNPVVVSELCAHRFSVYEPGLLELSRSVSAQIAFTSDARDLSGVDVCFVSADVPTDSMGRSDLQSIRNLVSVVDEALGGNAPVVLLSQVPPGFSRELNKRPEQLFYQVETLVFGQALERALKPERFIVGCATPAAPLPTAYRKFLESFGCPILQMRYESAELAKIAVNMFLVSSVTTTNTIAELCEQVAADWQEIAPALRLDRRIGQHAYLAPGLGIGGGNLERDLVAFEELAAAKGSDAGIIEAWRRNSVRRGKWAHELLLRLMPAYSMSPTVGVLGLAYKQDTASTRNSAGVELIRRVPPNWSVQAFDPAVEGEGSWRANGFVTAKDEYDTCHGADALAIMTPWPRFRAIDVGALARRMRGKIIVDPHGVLDAQACRQAGLEHFQLGRG